MAVKKIVCHGRKVLSLAREYGWLPGARYTNLRDLRDSTTRAFLDVDWKNYSYRQHLAATKLIRPILTVARDVFSRRQLATVLTEAESLLEYCDTVVIVPKCRSLEGCLKGDIPSHFIIGFSVPTRYGETTLNPHCIDRPTHLLGGRPDIQRRLADIMPVVSLDCNRFTLDASFGDYFDGETFRPHPVGGYERCIRDSLLHINQLWKDYKIHPTHAVS